MYLFGRTRSAAPGRVRAAMAVAAEATERARQAMGHQVYSWTTLWSPGVGTVLFSTRVQSMDELRVLLEKWVADGPAMDWLEEHADVFAGPSNDLLTEVVHGAPTGEPGPFVTAVRVEAAPGAGAEAMALGIEITDAYARLTGHTPMLGRAVTGTFAGLSWITSFPDLSALEAANAAAGADSGWQDLLGRSGACYLPGATTTMWRRLV